MDHDDVCKFKKVIEAKKESTVQQQEQQDPYELVVSVTGQMYPRYINNVLISELKCLTTMNLRLLSMKPNTKTD